MTDIDWTEAPEGATHYFAPFFYRADETRAYVFETTWSPSAYSSRQIDRLAVKRPPVESAWSGDGLPPVGTVCERHLPGELTNSYSWVVAKVIWHNGPTECAVIRSSSKLAWCDEFRPIKTPAQIAADEREAAAKTMRAIVTKTHPAECPYLTLYDAGLRFPKGDDQ